MTALHLALATPKDATPALRAAIFDMDGLMLDSERLGMDCWRQAARKVGVEIHDAAIIGMIGMHTSRTGLWLREQFGPDYPCDALREACHEIYLERTRTEPIPLRPGILEMLDWLETRKLPKAVATSTRRQIALHHLEMASLLHRFDFVVGGDEIANPKPAPDIYRAATSRLRLPASACVVFEDSDYGAQAAHAAGCRLVIIPDLRPPSPETRALGAPIVASLHEARALIRDW